MSPDEAFEPELNISVIIPVHNGGTRFRRCLSSLAEAVPPPGEIIVISDGGTDGSWRVAEEYGAQVITLPTSGGPARARNLGAGRAKGDILFFVDADVTIPPDTIGQVAAAFNRDPDLTALFGSYNDEPAETNFLSQYKNLLHHYVHQTSLEEASTFWGACGAIRKEIFLSMSGFDERYGKPSIEDIELGNRLKRAGYRIRLLKDLKVKHLKRWEVLSLLKADFFYRALPWTEMILREGRFIDDLNIKISSRISVISVYLLVLTLLASFITPWFLVPGLFLITVLLVLNRGLYCFFREKRGVGFALKTIPWHWFYFFYSGLAFAIGFVQFRINKSRSSGKNE